MPVLQVICQWAGYTITGVRKTRCRNAKCATIIPIKRNKGTDTMITYTDEKKFTQQSVQGLSLFRLGFQGIPQPLV